MVRAIFFDIDDTLYASRELAYHARENAVNAMIDAGLSEKDPEKVFRLLEGIVREKGSNFSRHFDLLLEKLGMPWNPAIIAAGVAAYHDTKLSYIHPYPDTVPVLLKLREKGYRLGVITNGVAVKQWEKLIRLGLNHFFHSVVISESYGVHKPSRELYGIALREMGVDAKDAVMVGDKIDADISGAKDAGFRTVWISHKKPLSGDVKPDAVVESIAQLPQVIEELGSG